MGGVRAWAAKRIGALVTSLKPPDVALAAVTLRGADLHATLTGESIPRHVQNIDLKLRFGRDYRSLTLDLTGALHLTCLVLSCLVLSCLVLSCLVLSCLVLSCLVLSCLVLWQSSM